MLNNPLGGYLSATALPYSSMSSFPTALVGQCPGLSSWEQTASHSTGTGLPDWPALTFAICPSSILKLLQTHSFPKAFSPYSHLVLVTPAYFWYLWIHLAWLLLAMFLFLYLVLCFSIFHTFLAWFSSKLVIHSTNSYWEPTVLPRPWVRPLMYFSRPNKHDPLGWGRARRRKWLDKYTDTEGFKCHGGEQHNGSPYRFKAGG